MVAPDQPSAPFATLTDSELQVLRLLAAGHTVKSIAVSLDRSEASINERLRDARRKTCVGSSRELARLLDAQKIWDRNIDLSAPRPTGETLGQPPVAGRKWPKGTIMMLVSIPIAAAGLVMATTNSMPEAAPKQPAHAAATSKSPLAGSRSKCIRCPRFQPSAVRRARGPSPAAAPCPCPSRIGLLRLRSRQVILFSSVEIWRAERSQLMLKWGAL